MHDNDEKMPFDVTINHEEDIPVKKVKKDYLGIVLAFLKNWFKLPLQLKFFQTPVGTELELKKIDSRHMVINEDKTLAYYSNNQSWDRWNHSTTDQLLNHCIFMYLYEADEEIQRAMFKFAYMNLHNGYTLSNGAFWSQDGITFSGSNVSTETLAAVNLLFLKRPYRRGALPEAYEKLMKKIIENDLALDFMALPDDKVLAEEYNKQLKANNERYELVKLKNPATDMSPGCDPDKATVLLASLTIMANFCDKKHTGLYEKYKNVYGYGLKAQFSSNSLEVIMSLYVLYKLCRAEEKEGYSNLLSKKLGTQANIDTEFGNYLYSRLLGVKNNVVE